MKGVPRKGLQFRLHKPMRDESYSDMYKWVYFTGTISDSIKSVYREGKLNFEGL